MTADRREMGQHDARPVQGGVATAPGTWRLSSNRAGASTRRSVGV